MAGSDIDAVNPDSCWLWRGARRGRTGEYPQINVYVGGKARSLPAHRVSLVSHEVGAEMEVFYDLYLLYGFAGFEADHECNNPLCVNPGHLQWLSEREHRRITVERRGQTWRGKRRKRRR